MLLENHKHQHSMPVNVTILGQQSYHYTDVICPLQRVSHKSQMQHQHEQHQYWHCLTDQGKASVTDSRAPSTIYLSPGGSHAIITNQVLQRCSLYNTNRYISQSNWVKYKNKILKGIRYHIKFALQGQFNLFLESELPKGYCQLQYSVFQLYQTQVCFLTG